MTRTNRDSILQSNLPDIVSYFRSRQCDEVDQLAQRALTVIFLTDHLVQTGYEADADPFTANMLATSALASVNAGVKRYPFIRVLPAYDAVELCKTEEERQAVLDSAEDLIEVAEGLMHSLDPIAIMAVVADRFRANSFRV